MGPSELALSGTRSWLESFPLGKLDLESLSSPGFLLDTLPEPGAEGEPQGALLPWL